MEKVNKELKEKLALRNSAEGLGAEDEEMNQEVRDMIALGLLDKDWNKGLNKIDAKIQLNKVLSNNPSSQHIDTIPFENEEMNKEVRDMIDLGLLNKDWATGLSKTQAKIKFSQVLSNNPSSQHIGAVPFAEDEEMNQEVRDMIALGLLNKDWNKGLNKGDAKVKFNQILSNTQSCSSTQGSTPCSTQRPSSTQGSTPCSTQRPSSTQGSTPCSSQRSILPVNQSSSHVREKHPDKKKNYKLFPVSPDDQVFKDIFADFERCGMERKVKAIQCVENEKREKAFELDKKQLKDLHGNEYDLNIQELYHASNAPRNLICSRGLDQRLGQIGLFGRGIYFSDNVKKCEQYLEDTKGSAIYKCSVILGDMKEYPRGEKHPELKQEPPKDNGDYYDSVKGNINGFNEYIIYDNRKCLIQYRIVLEGAEDEDDDTSDIEERVAQEEEEEKKMEAWIRHVHYLVNTCTHEEEEDPLKEQEIRNIEKIRLVIRKRREIQTGETPTVVTYDLLREERKTWKKFVSKDTSHEISPQLSTRLGEVLPVEEDPIPEDFTASFNDMEQMIYDNTLSTFMEVTCCKYVDLARGIIKDKNGDLSNAIDEYYAMMY